MPPTLVPADCLRRPLSSNVSHRDMLDAVEFERQFSDDGPLMRLSDAQIADLPLSEADARFLLSVGLPTSAAPFLDFDLPRDAALPTLSDYWPDPDIWHGLEAPRGARYRVIGSTGSGDPIALDTDANGAVVYLFHDDGFRRIFINSSITQFAASLLEFKKLLAEAREGNGEPGPAPPRVVEKFVSFLRAADPAAIQPDAMWPHEIESFASDG